MLVFRQNAPQREQTNFLTLPSSSMVAVDLLVNLMAERAKPWWPRSVG
jgi:hypothetical protein